MQAKASGLSNFPSHLQHRLGFVWVRGVAQARRRSTLFASVPLACAAPYPSGAGRGVTVGSLACPQCFP